MSCDQPYLGERDAEGGGRILEAAGVPMFRTVS
jgi:hypothetical protein